MKNNPLPRLDKHPEVRLWLRKMCRLQLGETWHDPEGKHRVHCGDAAVTKDVDALVTSPVHLAIHDPPYNLAAFVVRTIPTFLDWCRLWIQNTLDHLAADAAFYLWMGADQDRGFQPLPDVMMMMRGFPLRSRSLITMRNQRGYGTQQNWMSVRQELL